VDNPKDEQEHSNEQSEETEKSLFGIIVHSFFIIPFLIAVFCALLFTAISLLTSERQTVYDYLEDVKTGGLTKRWQAAFELSKILADAKNVENDPRFVNEMVSSFKHSKHDDNRVRQYLALAMGRTKNPLFFSPLTENLDDEKEDNLYAIIYALGMLQDQRGNVALYPYLEHPNARLRSAAVVSIGNIGDSGAIEKLKTTLNDSEPNVQWGAAISLAKMGDNSGKDIIAQLLERTYLDKQPKVDSTEQK